MRASEEVIRINARGIVTTMADVEVPQRGDMQLIAQSVRFHGSPLDPKLAVAVAIPGATP